MVSNSIEPHRVTFQLLKPQHVNTRFLLAGDNILAVLRYLVMSEKLADSSEYRHGNMVFFDLLGVYVVAYPARVGTILNYMIATATFLYLAKKASLPGNGGTIDHPSLRSDARFAIIFARHKTVFVRCFQVVATSGIWPVPQVWPS